MKQIPYEQAKGLTVLELVDLTEGGTASVVITQDGEQRYLFLPHTTQAQQSAPEGDDLASEAAALAANPAFMAYLAECHARGEREGRKSFEEVWRELCEGPPPEA